MTEIGSMEGFLWPLIYAWLAVEGVFYLVFHCYLVPKANEFVEAQPYRDYATERHRLLFRIVSRILRLAEVKGMDTRQSLQEFIIGCFDPIQKDQVVLSASVEIEPESLSAYLHQLCACPPGLAPVSKDSMSLTSESSVSSMDEERDETGDSEGLEHSQWSIEGIGKEDMDQLFSWALFGRPLERFLPWEKEEMQKCYDMFEKQLGLVFSEGSPGLYRPRCLSFEACDPLHRPLLVYVLVMLAKVVVGLILRFFGFQRVVSRTGVVGWYRPARDEAAKQLLPMLFFHGLAPGGLFFYLPITLFCLLNDGRASFLFENPNITCKIGFQALTEVQYVEGVADVIDRFLAPNQSLSLVGHSFGSVPLTWLLHAAAIRDRIKQYVLLDPVTILLSEPDVMVNFLYKKDVSTIRMLAGSELFTEYYLRRHFFFFNSELWLDDIPESLHPIVALSGNDAIVNAPRVKEHIQYNDPNKTLTLLYWDTAKHADCVTSLQKWREIKGTMLQQELALVQQSRQ